VASWKERGRRDLTDVAAELVVAFLPKPAVEVITFVPGDPDRGLARGHAPAAALAAELSTAWSIPLAALLRRRPGVKRQRDLPRTERRRNVARAFTACSSAPARVCLVDDVYTTGSTATACATALRRAGARRVDVVCLARALR
jgi:predicted amidophosphoribosyltransferase